MAQALTRAARSPRTSPEEARTLAVAGWERCAPTVVTSALRLAALAVDADRCCLLWRTGAHGHEALDAGGAPPTDEQAERWLALAEAGGDGLPVHELDGTLVLPVEGPHGRFGGALALRPATDVPDADALALATAGHVRLLLASAALHTERATAYEALFEIGTQIQAQEANAEAIFALIVDRARELLDTDVAWLAMVDESHEHLHIKVATGTATPEFMRMEVRVGTGIGGVALKEGRAVAVRESARYRSGMPASVHRALDGEGVRSVLCAPLLRDGSMLGALYVGTRKPRDFAEESASLLSALAAQAAVTIENARLYQALTEKNETLERSFAIHRQLTDASLAGVGLDGIAAELARLIGHDIVFALPDGTPRCARYAADPDADVPPPEPQALDACDDDEAVDVMAGETRLGTLHALGGRRLAPLQRRALEHGATAIALELVKEQAALQVEWRLQGELLEELLRSPGSFSSDVAVRAERFGVDLTHRHHLAVLQPVGEATAGALLEFVRRALRSRGNLDGLVAQRGNRVFVALADDVAGGPRRLLEELQRKARAAGLPFCCGWSDARTDWSVALREAEATLTFALGGGRPETLVGYEDLGPLRFMLDAPDTTEMVSLVRDVLGPLAEHDARRNADLLFTLRVFLESGGHHPTTSERCHIHASTLKYRLARIAAILNRPLSDPAMRFELSLALEVLGVLELVGAAPFSTTRRPLGSGDAAE